jgi:hypothetical protein
VIFDSIDLYAGHLERYLQSGKLRALDNVALTADRTWNAETAVRIVLAEHGHLMRVVDRGVLVQKTRWLQLHHQLEALYHIASAAPKAECVSRRTRLGQMLQVVSAASA